MRTIENINGQEILIAWRFEEIVERHKADWATWIVIGTGIDGREYSGNCEALISDPMDLHATTIDCVMRIEREEEECEDPTPWEADYGGSSAAERQEQMHEWQKLK